MPNSSNANAVNVVKIFENDFAPRWVGGSKRDDDVTSPVDLVKMDGMWVGSVSSENDIPESLVQPGLAQRRVFSTPQNSDQSRRAHDVKRSQQDSTPPRWRCSFQGVVFRTWKSLAFSHGKTQSHASGSTAHPSRGFWPGPPTSATNEVSSKPRLNVWRAETLDALGPGEAPQWGEAKHRH